MRVPVLPTLGLALLLTACGEPDPSPSEISVENVVSALQGIEHVLDEDQPAPGWIASGLESFRRGRRAIAEGDASVRPLPPEDVRRRIAAADVVLIADLHPFDFARRSVGRLIETFADPRALDEGRVAIALEAVPPEWGAEVEALVAKRDRAGLLRFFRSAWPWPVEAYVDLLLRPALSRVRVLGVGGAKGGPAPGPEVSDADRVPALAWDLSLAELKYGHTFATKNTLTAGTVASWVGKERGRRQVFVLYGAAHLRSDVGWTAAGIADQLEPQGLRSVVIAPFFPSWEMELRRRFGEAAERAWFEVPDGVLRPPHATADAILALPRGRSASAVVVLPAPR